METMVRRWQHPTFRNPAWAPNRESQQTGLWKTVKKKENFVEGIVLNTRSYFERPRFAGAAKGWRRELLGADGQVRNSHGPSVFLMKRGFSGASARLNRCYRRVRRSPARRSLSTSKLGTRVLVERR